MLTFLNEKFILYLHIYINSQKYYVKNKKSPKFNPGKREPSPLLASTIEGSVIEVKSTTLTESGTTANGYLMV